MKLSKIDRVIIKDLFKATEGLYTYTLYSRYKISPKELYESIKKLGTEELLENDGERILLTKKGVDFAVKKQIARKESEKFDKIPAFSQGPRIEINSFYIPLNFE